MLETISNGGQPKSGRSALEPPKTKNTKEPVLHLTFDPSDDDLDEDGWPKIATGILGAENAWSHRKAGVDCRLVQRSRKLCAMRSQWHIYAVVFNLFSALLCVTNVRVLEQPRGSKTDEAIAAEEGPPCNRGCGCPEST
jgi:hypothetical protein